MKFDLNKRRRNEMSTFKDLLPDILHEYDLDGSFLIESIRALWPDIVGSTMSTHCMPDRLFKHTLFIAVDHAAFANEIAMMKDTIIQQIGEVMQGTDIVHLKCEVKRLSWQQTEKGR